MAYLTRSNDKELCFESVDEAIKYFTLKDSKDEKEKVFNTALKECDTLVQVADVWNRYTDLLFDGSSLLVKEG